MSVLSLSKKFKIYLLISSLVLIISISPITDVCAQSVATSQLLLPPPSDQRQPQTSDLRLPGQQLQQQPYQDQHQQQPLAQQQQLIQQQTVQQKPDANDLRLPSPGQQTTTTTYLSSSNLQPQAQSQAQQNNGLRLLNQQPPSLSQEEVPRSTLVMRSTTAELESSSSMWDLIRKNLELSSYANRPEVTQWLYWWLNHRSILNKILANSVPYLQYTYSQVEKYQLPADLTLLPLVESGYNPFAFSKDGAVGIWQIMPQTAFVLGLDISWWYDGRRDIVNSTDRSLRYLVQLHQQLGDWLLATAAYDCGASVVKKAVEKNINLHRPTDFWSLDLSVETKNYVPQLIAMALIVKNPQAYGLSLPLVSTRPYFVGIAINSQIDLFEAASLAETPISEIQQLNPGMRRWATDPNHPYTLLVPSDKAEIFQANLLKVAKKVHVSWQYHEVHTGQTLISIAKNYHTTPDMLRRVNYLDDYSVEPKQGILVPLHLNRTFAPLYSNLALLNESSATKSVKDITAQDVLSGNLKGMQINPVQLTGQIAGQVPGQPSDASAPPSSTMGGGGSDLPPQATAAALAAPPANSTIPASNTPSLAQEGPSTAQAFSQIPQIASTNNAENNGAGDNKIEPIKKNDNLKTLLTKLYGD